MNCLEVSLESEADQAKQGARKATVESARYSTRRLRDANVTGAAVKNLEAPRQSQPSHMIGVINLVIYQNILRV